MESNFVRADNSNLPKIDAFIGAVFFKNNGDYYAAEIKNVKQQCKYYVEIIYLQTFICMYIVIHK